MQFDQSPAMDRTLRTYLRLVTPDDAPLICGLRNDQALGRHLSAGTVDVESQRNWIMKYKSRERELTELYFVIVCDGRPCGVVRMYDFRDQPGDRSFCWGSWIIAAPRPKGLVTYSALCIYDIGFDSLHFDACHFDVRKENQRVNEFHLRSGAKRTGEDEQNYYYVLRPEDHIALRQASEAQIGLHRVTRDVQAEKQTSL